MNMKRMPFTYSTTFVMSDQLLDINSMCNMKGLLPILCKHKCAHLYNTLCILIRTHINITHVKNRNCSRRYFIQFIVTCLPYSLGFHQLQHTAAPSPLQCGHNKLPYEEPYLYPVETKKNRGNRISAALWRAVSLQTTIPNLI